MENEVVWGLGCLGVWKVRGKSYESILQSFQLFSHGKRPKPINNMFSVFYNFWLVSDPSFCHQKPQITFLAKSQKIRAPGITRYQIWCRMVQHGVIWWNIRDSQTKKGNSFVWVASQKSGKVTDYPKIRIWHKREPYTWFSLAILGIWWLWEGSGRGSGGSGGSRLQGLLGWSLFWYWHHSGTECTS